MICSLCGNNEASVSVLGNHFCEECNEKIKLLAKNDPKTVAFFRNPSNYPQANEYTVKYINGIISKNKTRVENTESVVFHENVARIDRENRRNNFIVVTSNNIEGYKITAYHGIATGTAVMGKGAFTGIGDLGNENTKLSGKFEEVKNHAMEYAIDNAVSMGGNALIATNVGFNTISSPGGVMTANSVSIVVMVSGTAVTIEKS